MQDVTKKMLIVAEIHRSNFTCTDAFSCADTETENRMAPSPKLYPFKMHYSNSKSMEISSQE